jgi:hypothetical protein
MCISYVRNELRHILMIGSNRHPISLCEPIISRNELIFNKTGGLSEKFSIKNSVLIYGIEGK